jgi:hypothetical protein
VASCQLRRIWNSPSPHQSKQHRDTSIADLFSPSSFNSSWHPMILSLLLPPLKSSSITKHHREHIIHHKPIITSIEHTYIPHVFVPQKSKNTISRRCWWRRHIILSDEKDGAYVGDSTRICAYHHCRRFFNDANPAVKNNSSLHGGNSPYYV